MCLITQYINYIFAYYLKTKPSLSLELSKLLTINILYAVYIRIYLFFFSVELTSHVCADCLIFSISGCWIFLARRREQLLMGCEKSGRTKWAGRLRKT